MKKTALSIALGLSLGVTTTFAENITEKPNILLIVADDLGYSDISPFGGEIPTPNLQLLAEEGLRFSQYYTAPMSAPARSMILTGNSNHEAGVGAMWWYDSTQRQTGYELRLTDRVVTMPEIFQRNGYQTLMAGKWHIGFNNGARPDERGFVHSFAFMGGGASHFNDIISLGEIEKFHTYYMLDGRRVEALPGDFYSTSFYTHQLNDWIIATPKEQPIFAYLAYTAPHDPIQAPDDWIKKFKDEYHEGYLPILHARIEKLKSKGFLSENTPLPDLELVERWEKLSFDEKQKESKRMQVYAAMVAQMDNQIGSIFQTLKETGRYKNTIIIFLSDNGANAGGRELYDDDEYWDHQNLDNSLENIGRKGSFESVGGNWADVNNAPYHTLHKTTTAQGGINTNFIIAGPMIDNGEKGKIKRQYMSASDLAPTLYELADLSIEILDQDNLQIPMQGVSQKSIITGESDVPVRTTFALELHNQSVYIDGDWKIRRISKVYPQGVAGEWGIFNIQNDPLETQNLSESEGERLQMMLEAYQKFADSTFVIEAKGELIPYVGE